LSKTLYVKRHLGGNLLLASILDSQLLHLVSGLVLGLGLLPPLRSGVGLVTVYGLSGLRRLGRGVLAAVIGCACGGRSGRFGLEAIDFFLGFGNVLVR